MVTYEYGLMKHINIYFIPYWIADMFKHNAIPLDNITNYESIAKHLSLEDQADVVICNRLIIEELRISDDAMAKWMSQKTIHPLVLSLSLQPERKQRLIGRLSVSQIEESESKDCFNIYTAKNIDMLLVTLNENALTNTQANMDIQKYFLLVKAIIERLSYILPYKMIPISYPGLFRQYLYYICTT